jgi:hypothetical protein
VTADNEEFARFVNGELFADGFGYKFRHDANLVDEDTVYRYYQKYFIDYCIFDDNHDMLSKETVLWFLRNPEAVAQFAQGSDVGSFVIDEMPQAVKDESDAKYEQVCRLMCWLDYDYAPISYAKLAMETSNFTDGYDGYDSEPPTEKDGKTSCYAVWYY